MMLINIDNVPILRAPAMLAKLNDGISKYRTIPPISIPHPMIVIVPQVLIRETGCNV